MAILERPGSLTPDDDRDATVIPLRRDALVPLVDEPDAETTVVDPGETGELVDPPVEPRTLYGTVTASALEARPAVIPAWLRNREQRMAFLRESARHTRYVLAFHTTRSPKYAARVTFRAPAGAGKTMWLLGRWVFDREGLPARLEAVRRNQPADYVTLSRQRDKRIRSRLTVAGLGLLGTAGAITAGLAFAPWWVQVPGALASVFGLAKAGAPVDKPLTDRTQTGPKFTRLTGEMVRLALCNAGVTGIREPSSITFPPPGIHRDGPGWLARVNLPVGVEAVDVIEKRGKLSSALRLPIDQVWPSAGPDHAGQLDLWVGYLPASKMGQPRWSLLADNAVTSVFEPHEFGTDERQRPVKTVLFERNFLIGGMPGSGKSYAARTIATIAALDPTCEMKIVEYKGVGDFLDLEPLCTTYACGVDDEAFAKGLDMLRWGVAEAARRGKRIEKLKRSGAAPQGKVTPEIASKPNSGLHPVFILIDEAHELFGDGEVGKEAAVLAERLIKRGRALNIILVIATQIPDKDSLPTIITKCTNTRWCLAVLDHISNDQILGTGAHKRGLTGTAYRPGDDAGWGVMTGPYIGPVRSHFPKPEETAALVARATALRGGVVGGDRGEPVPVRDTLADVRSVFAAEPGLHWETLAERLADAFPGVYAGMTAEMVRTGLARYDIQPRDIKIAGSVRKGARRDQIEAAISRRALEQ